ncbi:hypothetical protein [Streptomyces sp. TS71-3]|nr:hypothetical protein [Streptomyces sp. TS71-3]GHJ39197.1 hypothetical protein Sm713_48060 [Streptomyces sp. TS71-3]
MSQEIPRQGLPYEDLPVGLSFRGPVRTVTDGLAAHRMRTLLAAGGPA